MLSESSQAPKATALWYDSIWRKSPEEADLCGQEARVVAWVLAGGGLGWVCGAVEESGLGVGWGRRVGSDGRTGTGVSFWGGANVLEAGSCDGRPAPRVSTWWQWVVPTSVVLLRPGSQPGARERSLEERVQGAARAGSCPRPFLAGPGPPLPVANGRAVTSPDLPVTARAPRPTGGRPDVARIPRRGLSTGRLESLGRRRAFAPRLAEPHRTWSRRWHLSSPHRTAPRRAAPSRAEPSRAEPSRAGGSASHRAAQELGPSEENAQPTPSMPGNRSRRRRGSSHGQGRPRSRTARAELSFSVSWVEHLLREGHYARRLSPSAPVFLAAVIQYLTAKVLELAGNEACKSGRRRITPELVDMAVHNNALLSGFFGATTISQVAPGR
ncbi:histone H2A-Bbd type 1 [Equus asinus]